MRDVVGIVGGIFILVGIYLFVKNGKDSVNIISALGSNATKGIATLQGR